MSVTFDLFTKKTWLYNITLIITITTILFIAIAGFYNLQGESPFYSTLLILGVIVSFFFIFIVAPGVKQPYIKDGELVLKEDSLIIDNVKIPLSEANGIKLFVGYWRTKKYGRIMSNRIEVIDKTGNIYKRRFVVSSRDENKEFNDLIKIWNEKGVTFGFLYHNVII